MGGGGEESWCEARCGQFCRVLRGAACLPSRAPPRQTPTALSSHELMSFLPGALPSTRRE